MTRSRQVPSVLWIGLCLLGCHGQGAPGSEQAIQVSNDIRLSPIAEGLWVHTTYLDLPEHGRCPANGLLVIDGMEAMLIDLPWTDAQTAQLMDWIRKDLGAVVTKVVPTHWHQDCMGGLAEAHRKNAVSYALDKTAALAKARKLPIPRHVFTDKRLLKCGDTEVALAYPGPGHTTDNIVAWLPRQKVLFGGCLIKSMNARSLGNTADGDVKAYPTTLHNVRDAYPNAKIVVPGHGPWGGPELIDHTLNLCRSEEAKP